MQVTVPASAASATAGKGWRVMRKRPRSSPTKWLACAALPPLPKATTLWPPRKDSASRRATSSAGPRKRSALSATTSTLAAKCSAKSPDLIKALAPVQAPDFFQSLPRVHCSVCAADVERLAARVRVYSSLCLEEEKTHRRMLKRV